MATVTMTDVVDGVEAATATISVEVTQGTRGPQGPKGDPGDPGTDGAPGSNGTNGADGATGPQGDPGVGVPAGGTTAQVLAKASATDFDTEWVDQTGGGGGGTVDSVVAGTGISVDVTDPANPIVTNTGASAAQGALADSATQPGDLATVATTGVYSDLTGKPTLGTAAAAATGDFDAAGAASAAQAAATAASQPVDSDLTAIAALSTTGYGRAVLELANQAALMALLSSSTTTAQGIVELATSAEALTGTDTSRAVTPAALQAKIDALVNSAPGLLDTLGEIAAQLSTDESAVSALTTTVSGKLAKASNLSDLASASTARTNLGLGSAALSASTDFQPIDSDLTSLAALTTTAYGRALLELANQAALMTLLSASTTSASGIVELATSLETATGTDTVRAITPKGLADLLASYALLASPTFTGNPTAPTPSAGDNDTSVATTAFVTNAVAKQQEVLIFALGDETTAITTGLKVTVRMPFAMTLTSVRASLTTASSSGNPAFNVKESGTTIFSTTVTIDATELTSTTAATPAVLSDTSLADDAEMTFFVDTAGTGAKGAKITLIGTRT